MRLPIFALAVLALGLIGLRPAQAVDLPPAPVLDDEDEALVSGLYLRGDAGLSGPLISRRSRDRGSDGFSALVTGRLEQTGTVGAGIGYRFSSWSRADLTLDHRFEAAFSGTRFAGSGAMSRERADFDATSLMLNGYADLPLWNRITPYLGAGIGWAQVRLSGRTRDVVGLSVAGPVLTSQSETVLTWAVTSGVAFDLNSHLKVDLGYRYSRLGGGSAGEIGSATAPFRPRYASAHEIRLGARYLLD